MSYLIEDIPVCCPACRSDLVNDKDGGLRCEVCGTAFPVANGIPILIADDNQVFDAGEIAATAPTLFSRSWIRRIGDALPQPTAEIGKSYIRRWLLTHGTSYGSRCLILGAGNDHAWNDMLRKMYPTTLVTDVGFARDVSLICDGHCLPFPDDSFDCVTVMAVLEHVLEPEIVVAEIGRVLRPGGVIVADVPFMQQVHLGAYDFKRYTDLGLRWLFRNFDETARGVSAGPGSALLWSILYFAMSFTPGWRSRLAVKAFIRLFFFWLKYFDYLLVRGAGALDGACGVYFIGINRKQPVISASELIAGYRGADKVSTT